MTHLARIGATVWSMGGGIKGLCRVMVRFLSSGGQCDHQRWAHCPLCGMPVIDTGLMAMRLSALFGPVSWVPSETELVELCPLHQHLAEASRRPTPPVSDL
jgi:hypothetical protein